MTSSETPTESLLAICVFAALSDGKKSDEEREAIRHAASSMDNAQAAPVVQNVLLGRVSFDAAARAVREPAHRLLAYEMALAVCEADGETSPGERAFLENLRRELELDTPAADEIEARVSDVVLAPVPAAETEVFSAKPDNSKMILNYSILNGALELLPDTLATMAIVPLQVKMVYRIGKSHGVELGTRHIKEFAATIGAGMASQMLEGFARKLAGGFFKKMGGKLAGRVADQAAGSAFSFASTYAIGALADSYYGGGSKLSASDLKTRFQSLTSQARSLYETHRSQIESKARTLNPSEIFSMIRSGNSPTP